MLFVRQPDALTLHRETCNLPHSSGFGREQEQNLLQNALTKRPEHQAMLAAIITLSLLSLLVATEADPAHSPTEQPPGEPLRPSKGFCPGRKTPDKPDRLAA
jgi:hypothetical protein